MTRILISYFSLTGNTRKLAEDLAEITGADLQPIVEARPREGWGGYLRSAIEAVQGRAAPTLPPAHRVDAYDIVVVGSPVWMGHVSSPVRSYLLGNAARFNTVALFCTMGGKEAARPLQEMTELASIFPQATLAVSERELKQGSALARIENFAQHLIHPQPDSPMPPPPMHAQTGNRNARL